MIDFLRNIFCYNSKYASHPEAVIISCYFNPQKSAYRLKAFNKFYETIKHLNHKIVECVIGDAAPELDENENILRVYTDNLLWHKEALLNLIVSKLARQYKYVFWVDADVIFTNKNWLTESVRVLETDAVICQPFEWCVHLNKDEEKPDFNTKHYKILGTHLHNRMWRSFCANYVNDKASVNNKNYDFHGHVGFAWGARRIVLENVPLYDRALIGGADHIIAHAAAGQIPHNCIQKSFTENIQEVERWMNRFYTEVRGRIGYVKGELHHLWHGDINKRQYLKRIKDFTPITKKITQKDKNGLYITQSGDETYIKRYFAEREVRQDNDDGFLTSMAIGYMTDDPLMGGLLGGNPVGGIIGSMMNPGRDEPNYGPAPAYEEPQPQGIFMPEPETQVQPEVELPPIVDAPEQMNDNWVMPEETVEPPLSENFS